MTLGLSVPFLISQGNERSNCIGRGMRKVVTEGLTPG